MKKDNHPKYLIGLLIIPILIAMLFCQCLQNNKEECDYVGISRKLVYNIKENDVSDIRRMMVFDDNGFWNEGGEWGSIRRGAQAILDTISNINSIKTIIQFNKNSKISYAVVTFILSKKGRVENILQVSFLHPKSPLGCKVQYFEYSILGTSDKIDSRPRSVFNQ